MSQHEINQKLSARKIVAKPTQRGRFATTRTIRTAATLAVWFIAITLGAAACSTTNNDTSVTEDSQTETAEQPTMAESSPIGAFFSDDGGGMEAAQAQYNARVETEIVKCMVEEGFEYTPSGMDFRTEADKAMSKLTITEWVAQYGYGVSTTFDSVLAQQSSDPNTAYVQSLSMAEQMLWLQTLMGEAGPPTSEEEFTSRPLEQQGCIGVAIKATGLEDMMDNLSQFGEAYEQAEEQLKDNPDVINAQDHWSRCMSEAGYTGYENQDAPSQDFEQRLNTLVAPARTALRNLPPEQAQAIFTGEAVEVDQVPGLDVEALRELQAEEIRTATTDLQCYDTHMKDVYEPLRDQLQKGLIEEHSDTLNAIKNMGS